MRRSDRSSISSVHLADLGGILCSYTAAQQFAVMSSAPAVQIDSIAMVQHAPGNTRQLVGKRDGENVAV